MVLDDIRERLRGAAAGDLLPDQQLAADADVAIEILLVKVDVLEEKLKREQRRSLRLAAFLAEIDTDEDICKRVAQAEKLYGCGLEGRECTECILEFFKEEN